MGLQQRAALADALWAECPHRIMGILHVCGHYRHHVVRGRICCFHCGAPGAGPDGVPASPAQRLLDEADGSTDEETH